jgi:hypothetical protein
MNPFFRICTQRSFDVRSTSVGTSKVTRSRQKMITSQPFVLDDRNQGVALSKRGRPAGAGTGATIFLGLFFTPFILAGIWVAGACITSTIEWWQLQQNGVDITAKVMNLEITEDSDGDDTYYATYRFALNTAEGYHAYAKTKRVNKQIYYTLEKGGSAAVRYLKSDPTISRVGGLETYPSEAIFFGCFALFWNLIVGAVIWGFTHNLSLDREFATKSQLLDGTLTHASSTLDSDDDLLLKLTYQFRSPKGDIISGNISRVCNDRRGQPMPVIGTPIVVAYISEKKHRLL